MRLKVAPYRKFSLRTFIFFTIFLPCYCVVGQTNIPSGTGTVPAPSGSVTPFSPAGFSTGLLKNYVRTWTPKIPLSLEAAVETGNTVSQVNMQTKYYDGLGRLVQSVNWQASPTQNDVVAPIYYDGLGLEQFKFLPYASSTNDGSFQMNPYGDQNNFYSNIYPNEQPAFTGEQFYYSHIIYEPTPLNRVAKTFLPGNSWAGSEGGSAEKSVTSQYLVNNNNDQVQIWTVTFSALAYSNNDVGVNIPSTSSGVVYQPGTLYKNVTIDEHGHAVVEYKDMEGRLVLRKMQVDNSIATDFSGFSGFLSTYYVYDDINQLRFVIPPKTTSYLMNEANTWQFDPTSINELCFRYEYDGRRRLIASKKPGAAWEYFIYDMGDKQVFRQDGNMRNNNQWLATLYDGVDRGVETGMLTYVGLPTDLQAFVTSATTTGTTNPVSSSQTISGVSPSSIPPNVDLPERQPGVTLYQATQTITFEPGFVSEDGANFVGQIILGVNGTFTNTVVTYNNPLPTGSGTNFIPLTITNFDNYSNTAKIFNTDNNSKLNKGNNIYADPLPGTSSVLTRGLLTSALVRVLQNPADLTQGPWLENASFYDDKARVIQSQNTNYSGGLDMTTTMFDFISKPVCTYEVHNNSAAGIGNFRVMTNTNYDQEERVLNEVMNINDDNNPSSPQTTQRNLFTSIYDALGQLKEKQIGQQPVANAGFSTNPLEDDNIAFNIRGWLKGINWQGYGSGGSTSSSVNIGSSKYFGLDISYDWGYGTNQFNGNLSGERWMSAHDGAERSYGYDYDFSNRLLYADFNQNFGGSWTKTDPSNSSFTINFSTIMGDGVNQQTAYDENGNIQAMQQYGLVLNQSQLIDNLTYAYNNNSNKLSNISDAASQHVNLGDFTDNNTSGDDYGYDVNGNLITDKNRFISGSTGIDQSSGGAITYNHLNLPFLVSFQNKGTIQYIFDALGTKLQKKTTETTTTPNVVTTTSYIGGFVYQNNLLQYFIDEEGRVRPITPNSGNNQQNFAYDYFLKDHLGNTRAVLTDELQLDIYPAATLESGGISTESAIYNINTADIVANPAGLTSPTDLTYYNNNGISNPDPGVIATDKSQQMYRLNAQSGDKMGLGVTLRVIAGDNVAIYAKSFWQNTGGYNNGGLLDIATSSLLGLFANTGPVISSGEGATATSLTNSSVTFNGVENWLNNRNFNSSNPKAYLNWVLFDDNFQPVQDPQSSNVEQVGSAGTVTNHSAAVNVTKSGYLYVYCSNESSMDVYFDNLQVVQNHGPLVEASSYYPFGLTMAGLSDITFGSGYVENKYRYNKGSELQNKEFRDGSGLEM